MRDELQYFSIQRVSEGVKGGKRVNEGVNERGKGGDGDERGKGVNEGVNEGVKGVKGMKGLMKG